MKTQLKFLSIVSGVAVALTAVVLTAFASAKGVGRTPGMSVGATLGVVRTSLAACTKMTATDVAWVTLNDDGDIEEQVESYPSGVTSIVPVFQFDCVPKKTTIVTVFSLDGETVYNDSEQLKASNTRGTYGYPLSTTDESPMAEGEWGVEFYNNKTLLSSGVVVVGETEGGDTITVIGTIKDAKTKKPIKGALILFLNPGTTVEDFVDGGQKEEDVYTAGKTDSKGQFELESPLEREVEYSVIVVAKGYKPIAQDGLSVDADEPDPLELNITLSK